jgi:hypothetical protein
MLISITITNILIKGGRSNRYAEPTMDFAAVYKQYIKN